MNAQSPLQEDQQPTPMETDQMVPQTATNLVQSVVHQAGVTADSMLKGEKDITIKNAVLDLQTAASSSLAADTASNLKSEAMNSQNKQQQALCTPTVVSNLCSPFWPFR